MNIFTNKDFFVGCNYWASHAGMYMWRNWDAEVVKQDLKLCAEYNMTVLRVFPLWPDFQPLTRFYGGCGARREFGQNGGPLQNPACMDYEMVDRFRFLCDEAEKNGIKLVIGLLTGWMSGRLFVPPALEDKPILTDPESIQWQVRFVRAFINATKDCPAIAAWDLGNECNCMGRVNQAEAWNWMNTIASAIRLSDSTRPVVSGMHSLKSDMFATWNLQDQGELMDVLTTHPYPLFTPECNHEPFNTMRNELHPTAESLIYQGVSGKTCFPEEAGALGPTLCSVDRASKNICASLFSCWANGLPGYIWWCAFDQSHLDFPPYDWNAIERELGLFTIDSKPKKVVEAMRDFKAFVKQLPFELPERKVDAVCLVSEKEDAWIPSFGAFMLSRQAGFDIQFAGVEQELPESDFYIVTYPRDTKSPTGRAWKRILEKVANGANLLITLDDHARISCFKEMTGVEIDYSFNESNSFEFALKSHPEQIMRGTSGVRRTLIAENAEVLAEDTNGNTMMTLSEYGKGKIFVVNFGIEQFSVEKPGCFYGDSLNPLYLLYREAMERAGIQRKVVKTLPGVGITEHQLDEKHTVCVAINYDPQEAVCPLQINGTVKQVWNGVLENDTLKIDGNNAVVFLLEH